MARPSGLPRSMSVSRAETQPQRLQQRSKSALRRPDDPDAVARSVLELRQQRQSGKDLQRSHSNGSSQENKAPKKSTAPPEGIDGLLAELEELRFFAELDEQDAPATAATNAPPLRSISQPKPRTGTSRNFRNEASAQYRDSIPNVVRASSATRSSKLPPPPPDRLSPRKISKMDRTTLELETQTLCRKLEMLQQEKQALESAVEMYELSLQDQTMNKEKTSALERDVRVLHNKYIQAKQEAERNMATNKAHFETQILTLQEQVESSKKIADNYKVERDMARKDVERRKKEYAERKNAVLSEFHQEKQQLEHRQTVLEAELDEMAQVLDELRQIVAEKDDEIAQLKAELTQAGQLLAKTKHEQEQRHEAKLRAAQLEFDNKEEEYQAQVQNLQEKVNKTQQQAQQFEAEQHELQHQLTQKDLLLDKTQKQCEEQTNMVESMTSRLDSVHAEYRVKFGELKEIYETKEKRRMKELVEAHSEESNEYERRLQALQEQLTLATDRHIEEMRNKDEETERKLQAQKTQIVSEWQQTQGVHIQSLEEKLAELRYEYQEVESERRRLQQQVEEASTSESQLREWEYQGALREKEISRLREKSERLVQDLSDKEARIQELSERLSESESRSLTRISQMETQHADDLRERDDLLLEQKKHYRTIEAKLRAELAQKENNIEELNAMMELKTTELQQELEQVKADLSRAKETIDEEHILQTKLDEMQASYKKLQTELASERARFETTEAELKLDLATLEGKVRASEVTLKQKREYIDELEEKVRQMEDEMATISATKSRDVEKLSEKLSESHAMLQKEKTNAQRLNDKLVATKEEMRRMRNRLTDVEDVQDVVTELKKSLADAEDERIARSAELAELRRNYDEAMRQLSEYEAKIEESSMLANALQVKDRETNNATQQYSSTICELKEKLEILKTQFEEERESKDRLHDRISDLESDLEFKEHQLNRMSKLQKQLREITEGREQMQSRLGELEVELDRKERAAEKLEETVSELKYEIQEKEKSIQALRSSIHAIESELEMKTERLDRVGFEHQEKLDEKDKVIIDLRNKLERVEADLVKKLRELDDTSGSFSTELQAKIEDLTRTKAMLEAKARDLEEEREVREQQVKETSEKHSNQILELQMKVEELNRQKNSLRLKLSQAESELDRKNQELGATSSHYSEDLSDLQSRLSQQIAEKQEIASKLEALELDLEDKKRQVRHLEKQQADTVQNDLDREKRNLKMKVGDIEAELERKEKQIKDIVERYTRDIESLEDRLYEQSRAKTALQREVDGFKNESANTLDSSGLSALRERIASLEKSVEFERYYAKEAEAAKRKLTEDLRDAEEAKQDLSDRLQKANSERAEVITALEDVINEVQSREEEIESLANILRKRDEELEHAKLIATKALASAQEIKARYKEKGSEKQAELSDKIADLTANLKALTIRNEALQEKTSKLEKELSERDAECRELRMRLSKIHFSVEEKKTDEFEKAGQDNKAFTLTKNTSDGLDPSPSHDTTDSMSTQSADLGNSSSWLHDFGSASSDSGDQVSFPGVRSEPGSKSESRRAIERDALRKYVRKRYLKSKNPS